MVRPDPAIGRLLINESSGHSTYDGLLLTANVQISRRSQIMANYTLSRTRVHSGAPYTPVIGLDIQHDANDLNDRAILDGRVASRNILRQSGFVNLDFQIVKDITLPGEGHHLDLFTDVFNITGADNLNFGPESISLFGAPAAPIFTGGQPLFAPATTRYGGPRQVQFTVRVVAF